MALASRRKTDLEKGGHTALLVGLGEETHTPTCAWSCGLLSKLTTPMGYINGLVR